MKKKTNGSIRTQILISFLSVSLLMIAVGLGMFLVTSKIGTILHNFSSQDEQFNRAQSIIYLDEVLTQSLRNYVFTGDEKWQKRYDDNGGKLDAVIKAAEDSAASDEVRQIFSTIDKANVKLVDLETKVFTLAADGKTQEALSLVNGDEYSGWKQIYAKAINDFLDNSQSGAAAMKKSLNQTVSTSKTSSLIILFATILLAILIGILAIIISARIARPIRKIAELADRIAQGDFRIEVDFKQRNEVGMLAAAFQNMIERVSVIVGDVKNSAETVAVGSQQMSSSSEQLSQGATEQAAAAEQVSSSMEQMSSNIGKNAENATLTESIAIKAAQDAEESGKAVVEAVEAVREIAEKISIIEEISRQTNMLSLNASIEAARAGEHGKGFAVVASEVGKLAERSKNAAGEIGTLAASTVAVADRAREMLIELVPNIRKTADLVQEISASSGEQNNGAEQINNAILQLDQVIQQNASASEEMASTSEELAVQAEHLKETISFFKVKEDERLRLPERKREARQVKEGEVKRPPSDKPVRKQEKNQEMGITLREPVQSLVDDADFEDF